jgi:hypothetical protein
MMASTNRASFDSSRRVFRGRAGPTDRNLPKHQARRRKQPKEKEQEVVVRDNDDKDDGRQPLLDESLVNEQKLAADDIEAIDYDDNHTQSDFQQDAVQEEEPKYQVEIQHLLNRVKNVRESIQLSLDSLANPSTWQQNVLNTVLNCVNEWKSILSHYQDDISDDKAKDPALKAFELIQMSLQSGPLAGSKPGYFKRCGSQVAMLALEFLNTAVPDQKEADLLRFTEKQTHAIEAWRANARKAAENDKPPSKSILKKQMNSAKKKKK